MPVPTAPSSQHLEIHSDPARIRAARAWVESFCLDAGLSPSDAGDVGLCLNEALANIIRHAYAGAPDRPIHIEALADPDQVQISLRDWGSGEDPTPCMKESPDPNTPGGLGLICIRQLMSHFEFIPQPDGMVLILCKSRIRPPNADNCTGTSEHP